MTLNWLDIVLILIVALSVIEGVKKGFARVGIGFAAAILGVVFGIWFYGTAGYYLLPFVSSKGIANFIGFWVVFLICVLAGALLGKFLGALFKWVGLSWIDRLLGALFGILRGGVAAVALVLVLVAFSSKPPPKSVANSRYAPYLVGAANVCAELAPRELKDGFFASYDKLKQIWSKTVRKKGARLPETEI